MAEAEELSQVAEELRLHLGQVTTADHGGRSPLDGSRQMKWWSIGGCMIQEDGRRI